MTMRVFEYLEAITPDAVGLDLISLDLLQVFQSADLLPDLQSDVTADDALTLAAFAFCRWRHSWDNTPATMGRQLHAKGLPVWLPSPTNTPQNTSITPAGVAELRGGDFSGGDFYALTYQETTTAPDFVTWLAGVFVDWDRAQEVQQIQIDKTQNKAFATLANGERLEWASPNGAQRVTTIERLTIQNTPTETAGRAPIANVAIRLAGMATPIREEGVPRPTLRRLAKVGNSFLLT